MALAEELAAAASGFLAGLGPADATGAVLPFAAAERTSWAYWPAARPGVPLWQLDRRQVKLAHRLLAAMLALPAYARAVTVMNLDEVLDRVEGYRDDRRHGGDYWVVLFGRPGSGGGAGAPWAVRFEGHHVSVTATVRDGSVRLTPLFLGANPAVVLDGEEVVTAPLGPEERLGFELLYALPPEQHAAAVVSAVAPGDILTRNDTAVGPLPDEGVPLHALRGAAASAAAALLEVYLGRFAAGADRLDPTGATFAWAGADEPGAGHYYRIAGPRLVIELDNTQSAANHVHTVVRDPRSDFGADLLAGHLRGAHA